MTELAWIVLGFAIGLVATRFLGQQGRDRVVGICFGAVGALAGGWLFTHFATGDTPNPGMSSFIIAANSAVLILMIHRAITMPTEER